jgi:hypothetical protein
MKTIEHLLRLCFLFPAVALPATRPAASCNTSDVQAAIESASSGDTVTIPPGTCTWSGGVTISGKGIIVTGAGSGRIVAYDDGVEKLAIATGNKTVAIAGFSPGFTGAVFHPGSTVRISENNFRGNYMQGTISSYSGNTLTVNVATVGGSGTRHRWLVSTPSATTIVNNSASTPLFTITEDTSIHTNLSGIHFAVGTGAATLIMRQYHSGGQAILIHDCWIEQVGGGKNAIDGHTTRGVIWNCTIDGSNDDYNLVNTPVIRVDGDGTDTAWTTPAPWGNRDTTGQAALYIETNDFHSVLATDNDSNGRMVFRHNLVDHSMFATHGPDTSSWGERYFEYYDNKGVFYGYNDGTTLNLNGWIFIVRGGTFVVHHNDLPAQYSQDYGTKGDVIMTVMNLTRNGGPNPCWGAGASSPGQHYPSPRQVGLGYVTGKGTAHYPPGGLSNSSSDSIGYVGDSEPAYIWSNSRSPMNVGLTDYSPSDCANHDTSANYVKLNRDYFDGTEAKPGYAAYTYPHPLTIGGPPPSGTPPTITSVSPITDGQVGVAYSYQFTATGDTPITWSGTGVPGGMNLASSGLLSGAPTTEGTTTINVTATNAKGSAGPTGFSMTTVSEGGGHARATETIASGIAPLGTAAISAASCAPIVTVGATQVTTTDVIAWVPNVDLSTVTGYAPAATGGLTIYPYPTAGNVNFKVCNPTSASIAPGAVTLNWRVTR